MRGFIQKSLGLETFIEEINIENKLPMIYSGMYDFKKASTQNVEWIIAIPKEQINLTKLRKQHRQIEKLLDMHCVVYLKNTNIYSKKTMIAEGIPFVIENRDIYLPFLGILLNADSERNIKPVQKLSFLTQKIIITAFYEDWQEINVTKTAERIDITKMSASRCFDEIEFFEMPILGMKGKSRVINIPDNKKELWERIKGIMRNPVVSIFNVKDDLKLSVRGGMSALADYSMIEDNVYPTYIISKKDLKDVGIQNKQISVKSDVPGCVVLEVGYFIPFKDGRNMDPLSLMLSLTEEELSDERVKKQVSVMLEEFVW